jgi:hypothetical protein
MTNLEGLPSYFWLTSSRLKPPVRDDVPYTTEALKQDLLRVRNAWEESQASRHRDAIYVFLTAVFDLVGWWTAEKCALERAHKALRLRNMTPFDDEEPFAAIIRCTADRGKVDKRTRSKWSRALRGEHGRPPGWGSPRWDRARAERGECTSYGPPLSAASLPFGHDGFLCS